MATSPPPPRSGLVWEGRIGSPGPPHLLSPAGYVWSGLWGGITRSGHPSLPTHLVDRQTPVKTLPFLELCRPSRWLMIILKLDGRILATFASEVFFKVVYLLKIELDDICYCLQFSIAIHFSQHKFCRFPTRLNWGKEVITKAGKNKN